MWVNDIIDRIKLPFRQEKELFSALYDILGFYPHNINLYKQALDKLGFIVVRSGNVRFVGTRDFAVEIPIITDDDSTANITFENVCLRSADETCVRLGKNSHITITLEGTNTLLTCSSSAFAWQGLSYVQLMLRSVWTYNIEELQGIDIDMNGEKHVIEVEHYIKKNANGNDADGVTGTLDGQEIIEKVLTALGLKK